MNLFLNKMILYCAFGCKQPNHNGVDIFVERLLHRGDDYRQAFEVFNRAQVVPCQSVCKHPIDKEIDPDKVERDRNASRSRLEDSEALQGLQ